MDLISTFSNEFMIEFIGNSKEFIRLNDSIKDFIQRLNLKLSPKYVNNLKMHVKNNFVEYSDIQRDISDYVISVKEALKLGPTCYFLSIPNYFGNHIRKEQYAPRAKTAPFY